eukprot:TRINITY_DN50487_c0_g1_i1.p1 TRINITY_DN50487_c0_g1~~TRINITY_DN50487_c0_g1_i1.p1  ORF type:complete len:171 (-),score=26.40 TRINITY_DN50487_c0_g1_i1:17-529(-)
MKFKLPELKIGNLIAKIPIIQGGMGVGISLSGLASAVANEGGIGVISAVGLGALKGKISRESEIDSLREEIQKSRILTDGILGLNIMVALTNFDDLVTTALEEKIDILFFGAGLPLKMPPMIDLSLIHISEPTRPLYISYAVFCLKKKKKPASPKNILHTTHPLTTQLSD